MSIFLVLLGLSRCCSGVVVSTVIGAEVHVICRQKQTRLEHWNNHGVAMRIEVMDLTTLTGGWNFSSPFSIVFGLCFMLHC
jgi:hypothetical protein